MDTWFEQQRAKTSLVFNDPSFIFSFFIILLVFILFGFNFKQLKTNKKHYKLPPSPWKLPIIGNLHQIMFSLPHHSLHSLAKRYGPLMFIHFGKVPTLVVSSATMAEVIMKTHDLVCSSRPKLRIAELLLYGKDVGFSPYGEYWRQMRKICILQLLSVKKVQSYRVVREEEITLMIKKIKQISSSSLGGVVNLSELLPLLTSDIVCRVAYGKKYCGDAIWEIRFKEMMDEFGTLLGALDIGDLIPSLSWVTYFNGLDARIKKNFRHFDTFLEQVIEDHISHKKNKNMMRENGTSFDGEGEEEEDFVDILLRIEEECNLGIPFSRDSIKAIIMDMFAAGTDTTYTAIEWTMAEIMRHPDIMKEVQEEVRNITRGKSSLREEDICQMHYLRAVIKETLRLHPPLPLMIPHESTKDIEINGYCIPAKTRIIVNSWAIGRDPKSWKDPNAFKPQRFLNENRKLDFRGHDFQLIPFGAGRRGCPGLEFAMAITELALANLLNEFSWEMPDGIKNKDLDMEEGPGVTVHKKSPLNLKATPFVNESHI